TRPRQRRRGDDARGGGAGGRGAGRPAAAARATPLGLQLVKGALARILVLAPAVELRAVADPPRRDVVEADLDHELGAQLHPLEVAPLAPPARLARAALTGLVRRQRLDQLALLLRLQSRAVPAHPQVPFGVVEP